MIKSLGRLAQTLKTKMNRLYGNLHLVWFRFHALMSLIYFNKWPRFWSFLSSVRFLGSILLLMQKSFTLLCLSSIGLDNSVSITQRIFSFVIVLIFITTWLPYCLNVLWTRCPVLRRNRMKATLSSAQLKMKQNPKSLWPNLEEEFILWNNIERAFV